MYPAFTNSVDPDQFLKKPTDLDLHCLSFSIWKCINNLHQVIWLADNLKWVWHLNLFSMTRVALCRLKAVEIIITTVHVEKNLTTNYSGRLDSTDHKWRIDGVGCSIFISLAHVLFYGMRVCGWLGVRVIFKKKIDGFVPLGVNSFSFSEGTV